MLKLTTIEYDCTTGRLHVVRPTNTNKLDKTIWRPHVNKTFPYPLYNVLCNIFRTNTKV